MCRQRAALTSHNLTCNLDIFLASHEDQDIACRQRQVDQEDLLHSAVDIVLARGLRVGYFDGEGTTWNREARSVAVESRELGRYQYSIIEASKDDSPSLRSW